MVAGDWMRYRASPALQELTREANAACGMINRIYYDDVEEAMRLFHGLVPGARAVIAAGNPCRVVRPIADG